MRDALLSHVCGGRVHTGKWQNFHDNASVVSSGITVVDTLPLIVSQFVRPQSIHFVSSGGRQQVSRVLNVRNQAEGRCRKVLRVSRRRHIRENCNEGRFQTNNPETLSKTLS